MKAKLELKHLSAYFPYQVKAEFKIVNVTSCRTMVIGTVGEIADNGKITCYDTVNSWPDKFKLLLRPLSWLTDEVLSEINCDPSDKSDMKDFRDGFTSLHNMPYGVIQFLLRSHYDVFTLIEQGLTEEIKTEMNNETKQSQNLI